MGDESFLDGLYERFSTIDTIPDDVSIKASIKADCFKEMRAFRAAAEAVTFTSTADDYVAGAAIVVHESRSTG